MFTRGNIKLMVELTAFPKCVILELMGKNLETSAVQWESLMGLSKLFVTSSWLIEGTRCELPCVFNDLVKMQTNEELHLRAI